MHYLVIYYFALRYNCVYRNMDIRIAVRFVSLFVCPFTLGIRQFYASFSALPRGNKNV